MKAIVVTHAGGPEVLEYKEVPTPKVKPGWTLVKVKGFGINHSEIFTRQGYSPSVHFPRILGIEAVGEVAETSTPDQFKVGQRVISIMGEMGRAFDGGYAEYVLLPNKQVYPVKASLSWEQLATIPETYYTAFGILKSLRLSKTDRVLVRAATSGVGLASMKLIKGFSPQITVAGTSRSTAKLDQLRQAGFDEAFVANETLPTDQKPFDKIIDLVGPTTLLDSLKHLTEFGIVNMTGELGGKWTIPEFEPISAIPNNRYLTTFSSGERVSFAAVQEMVSFVEEHHVDATPAKVFSLPETRLAHEYLESHDSFGKVIVMV